MRGGRRRGKAVLPPKLSGPRIATGRAPGPASESDRTLGQGEGAHPVLSPFRQEERRLSGKECWIENPGGTRRVFVTQELPGRLWFERLVAADCRVDMCLSTEPMTLDELLEMIGERCDGVIGQLTEPWGAAAFDALASAGGRAYSNYAVGYNNVDLAAATSRGIAVGNTPGVLTATTARARRRPDLRRRAARRRGPRLPRRRPLQGLAADALPGRAALAQDRGRHRRRAHRRRLREDDGRGPQDGPALLRPARQRGPRGSTSPTTAPSSSATGRRPSVAAAPRASTRCCARPTS